MLYQLSKRMLPRPTSGCSGSSRTTSATRACGRCRSSRSGSSRAITFRRSSTSRSSIAATCAARAAGWTWRPSSRPSTLDTMNRMINDAKAARQQLLRHPRRRAVHAPGAARHSRRASRLLFPDLHQRPVHHRRDRRATAAARQRHAADQHRRRREIVSDERRGRRNVFNQHAARPAKTACATASSPASPPASARRTSTTCSTRPGCSG